MKVLFCKISWMKYYKGVVPHKDEPRNGGSYVKEHGEGHEQFNFLPALLEDVEYCLGFVETKTTSKTKTNELHIEKIQGCEHLKKEEAVDDVLVIWCATADTNRASVVGWYKNAQVFRNYQFANFENGYVQAFNALARKEDCVLLPQDERNSNIWKSPNSKKGSFGFGQSMIWYGDNENENARNFVSRLVENIYNYNGENWIDVSAK